MYIAVKKVVCLSRSKKVSVGSPYVSDDGMRARARGVSLRASPLAGATLKIGRLTRILHRVPSMNVVASCYSYMLMIKTHFSGFAPSERLIF